MSYKIIIIKLIVTSSSQKCNNSMMHKYKIIYISLRILWILSKLLINGLLIANHKI